MANNLSKPERKSIKELQDSIRRHIFERALSNIVSTDIAMLTFAQIVDGAPIAEVAADAHWRIHIKHPVRTHDRLCPDVRENCSQILSQFKTDNLLFEPRLLQAYKAAPVGSVVFNSLLIELVAVAVHGIAVYLHGRDASLHKHDRWEEWTPPAKPSDCHPIWKKATRKTHPTLFVHPCYVRHEYYPDGVSDMVGYWAEDRIFGGVVVFDRGQSGIECNEVWLHPHRHNVTFRLCALTADQRRQLVAFLVRKPAVPAPAPSPLPILPDAGNLRRVDPPKAKDMHVFRDEWERDWERGRAGSRAGPPRCVFDYPELASKAAGFRSPTHVPPPEWQTQSVAGLPDLPGDSSLCGAAGGSSGSLPGLT